MWMTQVLYQVPSKTGGNPEAKEVLLEDDDPVWLELRHTHIADVCSCVLLNISFSWICYNS